MAALLHACGANSESELLGGEGGERAISCTEDSECDDGVFCNGVESCESGSCVTRDTCLPTQTCQESASSCKTECVVEPDADGDGHDATECGGDDCDDSNSSRFPGNAEVCDAANVDEDCDPSTFGDKDEDGDGYVSDQCCNVKGDGLNCGLDCDDKERTTNPNSPEVCDGVDTNCNGLIDDGGDRFWRDLDEDGYGDSAEEQRACEPPQGYVRNNEDCNDADDSIHPKQKDDTCNWVDEDCDGLVDEDVADANLTVLYVDADGDGFGTQGMPSAKFCVPEVEGYSTNYDDCDDTDGTIYPGAPDLCDRKINQCAPPSGVPGGLDVDDDADNDGFADEEANCVDGSLPKTDCDDAKSYINPNMLEACNGLDSDCDGVVDEGCPESVALLNPPIPVPAISGGSGTLALCPWDQAVYSVNVRTSGPRVIGMQLTCRDVVLSAEEVSSINSYDTYEYFVQPGGSTNLVAWGNPGTGSTTLSCDFSDDKLPAQGFVTALRWSVAADEPSLSSVGVTCNNFLAEKDITMAFPQLTSQLPPNIVPGLAACPEGWLLTGIEMEELTSYPTLRSIYCSPIVVTAIAGP